MVFSTLLRGARRLRHDGGSFARIALLRMQFPDLRVTAGTRIGPGCDIYVGRGSVMLLDGCKLGRGVTLTTSPGARLSIAAEVVGPGSVIVARESVTIMRGSKIAEYVTIRDANHDHSRALSEGVFTTAPVTVESNVWLAAKCSVLSGVTIGAGATVGAGAVVTKDVRAGESVVGVPARPIIRL